jgi:DNA-binding MarR family transcriptional regulator
MTVSTDLATLPDEGSDYRLDDAAGFLLRRAHQRATEHFNAVMDRHDVTPVQFAAMAKLLEMQPLSQNQLGRLTAMDPATISSVIARLVKRGWIVQAADPNDARLVMLSLSSEGRAAAEEMRAVAGEVTARILQPIPARDRARFMRLLALIA